MSMNELMQNLESEDVLGYISILKREHIQLSCSLACFKLWVYG